MGRRWMFGILVFLCICVGCDGLITGPGYTPEKQEKECPYTVEDVIREGWTCNCIFYLSDDTELTFIHVKIEFIKKYGYDVYELSWQDEDLNHVHKEVYKQQVEKIVITRVIIK